MTTDAPRTHGGSEAEAFDVMSRTAAAEIDPGIDPDLMAFGLTIMRAGNRLQQDMENEVHRPTGSTWAAFRVMFTIRSMGPLSPKRLARLSNTSAASISSVLNTLERHGLIERIPDPADARSVSVTLTPAGLTRVDELFRLNNARTAEWAASFSPEERQIVIALLHRLLDFSPASSSKA